MPNVNNGNRLEKVGRVLKEKREFKDQNVRSRQQPLIPRDEVFADSLEDDEDKENQGASRGLSGAGKLAEPSSSEITGQAADAIVESAESCFDCIFEPRHGHPAPVFGSDLALMSLPNSSSGIAVTAE